MTTKRNVLIVEDNDALRTLLHAVLSRNPNLIVDSARDGGEGMEKVRSGSYDVLVLDMMLPQIDGLEFIEQVKHTKLAKRPFIVAMTAATESLLPEAIITAPHGDLVKAVMRKPIDQAKLSQLVASLVEEPKS